MSIKDFMFFALIIVAIIVIFNYDIDNVVRGRIVSVSNKLMTKNLVVSELLSIFAMLFEHRIFEHRISEQKCDISPILLA